MVNFNNLEIPVILDEGYAFATPFILVYGTLRKGEGNYKRILEGNSIHINTYRLPKFALSGIHANFTGKEDDSIVVDLFELPCKSDNEITEAYEVNCALDLLEGAGLYDRNSYTTLILPIQLPEEEETPLTYLAKFYASNYVHKTHYTTGDYLSQHKYIDYPFLKVLGL